MSMACMCSPHRDTCTPLDCSHELIPVASARMSISYCQIPTADHDEH